MREGEGVRVREEEGGCEGLHTAVFACVVRSACLPATLGDRARLHQHQLHSQAPHQPEQEPLHQHHPL